MPIIDPFRAVHFALDAGADVSSRIAPPYDVLDAESKGALVSGDAHNISVIDLPHLPAKALGPDHVYREAGERYRQWIAEGVLTRRESPAVYAYAQDYTHGGQTFRRMGLIANVAVQDFGPGPGDAGGVFPHEQTFGEAKQDRFNLMRETGAQLSPIFGIYSDAEKLIGQMLEKAVAGREPAMVGRTADNVEHSLWVIDEDVQVRALVDAMRPMDIFIADGHHRYTTAINYRKHVGAGQGADWCMFVLVALQDPGMIVLPTHRVFGQMRGFSHDAFIQAAGDRLHIEPWTRDQDLASLEAALPELGPHAMGLYTVDPMGQTRSLAVITTEETDPLASTHGNQAEAWRMLDVSVLRHLVVEQILEPYFGEPTWKFPHDASQLKQMVESREYQMGVLMQPTPLESVIKVSEAGELMPQKSTFFYPKLATGLLINPLDGGSQ